MFDEWEYIFIHLAGWAYHPGYLREGANPPSLEAIARQADSMLTLIQERRSCPGDK